MAKSGRKRKRAEKAKTQLKTSLKAEKKAKKKKDGIRLAKGLNETKVDVTTLVKSVAVRGQDHDDRSVFVEKADGSGQLKRLKDVARDLLPKLSHHAASQRVDALVGLQDWMTHGEAGVGGAIIGQTVLKSLVLVTDPESSVRKECQKFLRLLLEKTPPVQLEPLHEAIGAHLCCGLSHLDAAVQRDALKLLDEVIAHSPRVVSLCAGQILPSCIEQVASLQQKAVKLKADLSAKVVVTAWRLSVFERMENVLRVLGNEVGQAEDYGAIVGRDVEYAGLFSHYPGTVALQEIAGNKGSRSSGLSNFDLASFAARLSLVLLDTWKEVAPQSGNKRRKQNRDGRSDSLLNKDAVDMLEKILNILHFLSKTSKSFAKENTMFSNDFVSSFEKGLMDRLPFHPAFQDGYRVRKLNFLAVAVYLELKGKDTGSDKMTTFIELIKGTDPGKLSEDELALVCSTLKFICDGGVDNDVDEALVELVNCAPLNPDVGDLLYGLCSKKGSELEATKQWISSLLPTTQAGKAGFYHFKTLQLMLKRSDSYATGAFKKTFIKDAKRVSDEAYGENVSECAKLMHYYIGDDIFIT